MRFATANSFKLGTMVPCYSPPKLQTKCDFCQKSLAKASGYEMQSALEPLREKSVSEVLCDENSLTHE